MELARILGVGLVTAVAALLLRSSKPELSFAVTIAGSVVILLLALEPAAEAFGIFAELGARTGIDSELIKVIVKIVAIGYLVEFSAGILRDFGQDALSDKLVFCGKIVILVLSVPILESVLELLNDLLRLIA